jgi:hypothetical protein
MLLWNTFSRNIDRYFTSRKCLVFCLFFVYFLGVFVGVLWECYGDVWGLFLDRVCTLYKA